MRPAQVGARYLVLVFVLVSCGSDQPTKQACIPGQSVACIGPGGCQGGQACAATGTSFDPCVCSSVPSTDAAADTGQNTAAADAYAHDLAMVDAAAPDSPIDAMGATSSDKPACFLGETMEDVEAKLFRGDKCRVCHVRTSSGMLPLYPTTLDLGSPGLAERMVDKPAESRPNLGKCAGRILVPSSDPTSGLLVEKVAQSPPSCGDRQPQALPALTADEISCIKRWAIMAVEAINARDR
jgi:hypothetical protein